MGGSQEHKAAVGAWVPATGRDVTTAGLVISRFSDGKIVEEWEVSDVFGLLQQTGALPEMVEDWATAMAEATAAHAPAASRPGELAHQVRLPS